MFAENSLASFPGKRDLGNEATCPQSRTMPGTSKSHAMLKVLGHGHVFAAWILISSGSDIIIQIRTRGFGVI